MIVLTTSNNLARTDRVLVRVPDVMYQVFSDVALFNADKEYAKRSILRDLRDWVTAEYPGYGIIAFSDYSAKEADEISERTGHKIMWGMYLVLEIGGDIQPCSVTDLLEQSPKQIDP